MVKTIPVEEKLRLLHNSGLSEKVDSANAEALLRLQAAEAHWIGMERVLDAVPGMKPNMILHAGPPIAFKDMLPVMQNGIIGGVLHERLAKTPEEAKGMILEGEIEYKSANDLFCVGPGVGITTPSMVTNVCVDVKTGLKGYTIPFEGRVGLGCWGVYNREVDDYLRVLEQEFALAVDRVLKMSGGINVSEILAQGMEMGDESHTRQTACGLILVSRIVPMLQDSDLDRKTIRLATNILINTARWFHPLGMAASMCGIRAVKGMPYCTIATTICQNGCQTGLKIADSGETWFLAPSPRFVGTCLSSRFTMDDAAPYLGDSTMTEVMGMGGFAAAAAPTVLKLRNGGWREAKAQSEEMRRICVGQNINYHIPLLDFTGSGLGIDMCRVLESGITPFCHGGIIMRDGGQIGAGGARFPIANYEAALDAFLIKYGVL